MGKIEHALIDDDCQGATFLQQSIAALNEQNPSTARRSPFPQFHGSERFAFAIIAAERGIGHDGIERP